MTEEFNKTKKFPLNTHTITRMYLLFSLNYVCKSVSIALPHLGSDSYVFATANKPSHRRYLAFTPNSQGVIRLGLIEVFFHTTILIDTVTGKFGFSAISTPKYSTTSSPVYTMLRKRMESVGQRVELLTNMNKITKTTTIAHLPNENFPNNGHNSHTKQLKRMN